MMLGRYRMSVRAAMNRYRDICDTVVKQQQKRPSQPAFSGTRKASKSLNADALKLVPALPSPEDEEGYLWSDRERCRTIVCGCGTRLHPLRSYVKPSAETKRSAYDINNILSQCVVASPPRGTYCDGAHSYNNPSRTVIKELSSLHRHDPSGHNSIHLLSIGGAVHEPVDIRANEYQYLMSRQTQRNHEFMTSTQAGPSNLTHYSRLDVPDDHHLPAIGANEWNPETSDSPTLNLIETATTTYLHTEPAATTLHDTATSLVAKRRRRAKTPRWERWALGTSGYRCPELECGHCNERFEDTDALWKHGALVHGEREEVGRGGYGERDEGWRGV